MSNSLYGVPTRASGFAPEELHDRLITYEAAEASLLWNKNIVYTQGEDMYAQCCLEGMPAQCGIIIYCAWDYIHLSMLKEHLEKCHKVARRLCYTKAMVTHNDKEFIETLVAEHGWKKIEEFRNQRSANIVYVATFDL